MKKIIKKSRIYKFFYNLSHKIQLLNENTNNILEVNKKMDNNLQDLKVQIENIKSDVSFVHKQNLVIFNHIDEKINELKKIESNINERTKQLECINTELLLLRGSKNTKKLLIVGFYGAPNLGDELMLEAILKNIENLSENIEITVMIADNPNYDVKKYGNINFIHYPKTNMDLHIIAQYFDKIIFGGGALIDDKEWNSINHQNTSLYNILINLSICAINKRKEVILLGLSTSNEFSNKDYLENLNFVINNSKYVSLRDKNSLEVLKKHNINCSNINIIDDLVYALPNINNLRRMENNIFSIGMILVSYTDINILKDMIKQVEKYLLEHITAEDKIIKLIPFYDFEKCDISRYEEILNNITLNSEIKIEILPYAGTYEKIVKDFKKCNLIIAMRYHASLIALKENVPVIHVIYDVHRHYINKMNDLLEKYNAKKNSISLEKYDNNKLFYTLKKYNNVDKYSLITNFNDVFKNIF